MEHYEASLERLADLIGVGVKAGFQPQGIAASLWEQGYRLDPYPNGKSKDELLQIIEAREAELARARELLYVAKEPVFSASTRSKVEAFLAETSGVKG